MKEECICRDERLKKRNTRKKKGDKIWLDNLIGLIY